MPAATTKRRKRRVGRRFRVAAAELRRRRRTPAACSPQFIDATLAHWQPLTDRVLTREDAREIIENVSGFFAILLEWDAEDQRRSDTSEAGAPP